MESLSHDQRAGAARYAHCRQALANVSIVGMAGDHAVARAVDGHRPAWDPVALAWPAHRRAPAAQPPPAAVGAVDPSHPGRLPHRALANLNNAAEDPLAMAIPPALWAVPGISVTSLVGSPLTRKPKKDRTEDEGALLEPECARWRRASLAQLGPSMRANRGKAGSEGFERWRHVPRGRWATREREQRRQ
jgi:hypothetical protein